MSQQDDVFAKTFKGVLIFLVALTVVIIIAANFIAGDTRSPDPALAEKNIAPVGKVKVADEKVVAPSDTPAPEAAAAAPADGQQVYQTACFACHGTGAAGAPKIGDTNAWGGRIAQGMDTLTQHAIGGYQGSKGYMPPKGGRADLADAAVAAAVEYMVSQSK